MGDSFFAVAAVSFLGLSILFLGYAFAQAKTIRKLRDLIDKLHAANARRLEDVCIPPASYGERRG